jgi:hypothetical protein
VLEACDSRGPMRTGEKFSDLRNEQCHRSCPGAERQLIEHLHLGQAANVAYGALAICSSVLHSVAQAAELKRSPRTGAEPLPGRYPPSLRPTVSLAFRLSEGQAKPSASAILKIENSVRLL